MRILLVSWYFPPSNTIGAVRTSALARYLAETGREIKVLTSKEPPYDQTLPLPIPRECIYQARWININALQERITLPLKRVVKNPEEKIQVKEQNLPINDGDSAPLKGSSLRNVYRILGSYYANVFNWPDMWIGWLPHAVWMGRSLTSSWRPDLVFASGPPFSGFLVGYILSRLSGTPLIVEFRDRWSDDPYYPPPAWRARWDRWAERKIVNRTHGVVTVSEPWAEAFRQKFGKPTLAVANGFDVCVSDDRDCFGSPEREMLTIGYFGGIYPGHRDPRPLFAALQQLGDLHEAVRVDFYGSDPEHVLPLAQEWCVSHLVTVHPRTTHEQSLSLQRQTDILLLMQWNDAKEQGNIPGKFFEYLGSRRPILGLGLDDGVPARLIRERQTGFFGNHPAAIAAQLSHWLDQKKSLGYIPPLPKESLQGLSRREQFLKLEELFGDLSKSALD